MVFRAKTGRQLDNLRRQLNDLTLLHQREHLEHRLFSPLAEDGPGDLEQADRGHQQVLNIFYRWRKEIGARRVRQILKPPARVNNVHRRSGSRSTVVSMPRKKPRISGMGRTGISSIRLSYWKTWSFSPGRRSRATRTS